MNSNISVTHLYFAIGSFHQFELLNSISADIDGNEEGLSDFDTDATALGTSLGEDDATIVGALLG